MLNIKAEVKSFIAREGTSVKKVVQALNETGNITTSYNNILNKLNNGSITFNEVQYLLDSIGYKFSIERK